MGGFQPQKTQYCYIIPIYSFRGFGFFLVFFGFTYVLGFYWKFYWPFFYRVATCAIFRRKVRYVRSICGVRWSALRVRSICCVSIKYEFLFDKSRKISINIM